ncbi:MAG: Co2+/Mg2+ efflux protein ApaG [Lentisphaeraceae bacterium]|nr:Co2+/Mg2+ efflux protein ApaG [Lentisphaeraceae bacterium]
MDMISSEVVTEKIRVRALPSYQSDHSSPEQNRYLFSYHIIIHNESEIDVTLKSRYWKIINAEGDEHEVRGCGVVGETPTLKPGEFYEYDSFSILDTPFGTMEGYYIFEREDGDVIKVEVARFYLATNANMGSLA